MDKLLESIIAALKAAGLIADDKVDAAKSAISKVELPKDQPSVDPSKISDPAMKQVIEALQNQNIALGQQIKTLTDTLSAERTEREKAVKIQQEAAKTEAEKKVADLVARAKKEGKIVQAKEEWLKKYATADYAEAESWVKDAPVDKNFKGEGATGGTGGSGSGDSGDVKKAGPLGNVNKSILKNVMEQSNIN